MGVARALVRMHRCSSDGCCAGRYGGAVTRADPATRRTLARLRLVRMELKREGKHVLQGRAITCAASTDVAKTWRLYDWAPPSQRGVA